MIAIDPTKPVSTFYQKYVHLFYGLLQDYSFTLEKFKKGSWVCDYCGVINPLNLSEENLKDYLDKDTIDYMAQCEGCSISYQGSMHAFSHMVGKNKA